MSHNTLQRQRSVWSTALLLLVVTALLVSPVAAAVSVPGATASVQPALETDDSVAAVGSDAFAPDWGSAGSDSGRSGHNPNSSGPTTNPDTRWIHEFVNDDWDVSTVVSDGLVFVGGYETLRAIDNETGEAVWNRTVETPETISAVNGVVVTTAPGFSGEIHAYHAANGTELWNETDFSADASVALDGTLYVTRGEYLHAFDLQTGDELWSVDINEDVSLDMSAMGDTIYATGMVSTSDPTVSAVFALNATDGSERWRFEMEGPVSMHPVVVDGSVYVGAGSEQRDQTDGAYDPKFYRLNNTDGHVEWVFDVNTRPHGAAVADGFVYLTAGNTVYGLNGATGESQWRHRLQGSITYGVHYYRMNTRPPAVADGVVYAVNDRGHVAALDGATGDQLWHYRLEGYAMSPAVADDRIYVRVNDEDDSGTDYTRVYALEESPFSFSGLTASKTTVEPDEELTVDVTVKNVDDEPRQYNLSLRADLPYPEGDPVLGWKNDSLGPGATTTLTFATALPSAAPWNLSVQRLLENEPAIAPVTVDVVHPTPDDRWTMDGFDANRSDGNPNTDGPSKYFQQAWNVSNVDEDTTPVIDDGIVYVIRHQNRYDGLADVHALAAYDESTGDSQWAYNFTAENRRPSGSPAVVNDTVYVVTTPASFYDGGGPTERGSVYAIDTGTGDRTWKTSVSINRSSGQYDHGPVVSNGLVYTAGSVWEPGSDTDTNASVIALDADTGDIEWTNGMAEHRNRESYGTYALGEGYLFATASDEVEPNTHEEELHAYDATSGSFAWTTDSLGLVVDHVETPVVADGLVIVVNEANYLNGDPGEELVAINVSTGAEEWRFTPSNIPNSYGGDDDGWRLQKPAVDNGSLYVRQTAASRTTYNRLHRVDLATGNATWNRSTNYLQHLQVVDGIVYAGETTFSSGYTDLYDATTGEAVGRSMGRISVAVANGTMVTFEPEDDRLEAVIEGSVIEYSDLSVDAHEIDAYENVTVTATATNIGTLPRRYALNLDLAPDDHSDRHFWNYPGRDGLLAPGESETITWKVRLDVRGDFVFFLAEGGASNSLDRYEIDDAGSVTVHVGDSDDGTVSDLGGPRTLAPGPDSWPKESFDARNTGNYTGASAPTSVGNDTVNWLVNSSYEWTSGPTVVEDTIFVGGRDAENDEAVIAVNATDGTIQWEYKTTSSGDVEVPPVYASGYVYTADSDDRVYQLNATTGEWLWTFNAGGNVDGIVVVDNVAYVTAEYSVYFDGETMSEDRLYALNATTREILWTFGRPSSGGMSATPAVADGTAYVVHDGQATYALDAATGAVEWSQPLAGSGSSLHSPVLGDGVVYVDDGTDLYALNASDGGRIVWNVPAAVDSYTGASPALANDTLFFTAGGSLRAVDATAGQTGGDERWSTNICAAARHSPVHADGTIFVPMTDSTLRAYDADTGNLVWYYEGYDEYSFTPAVVDGQLYTTGLENVYDVHSLVALSGGTTDESKSTVDFSGLSVDPTDAATGQTVTVSATVENLADADCGYDANFTIDGSVEDTASGTLGTTWSTDTETVEFTHKFSSIGTYNVSIADLPPIKVNVTTPQPKVDVSPTSHDYGELQVGQMTYQDFEVSNVGEANLDWSASTLTGANASDFLIKSDDSETYSYIWPGGSGYVRVYFDPEDAGSKSAALEITTNDTDAETVSIPLSGTGYVPEPSASVTPTSHHFNNVDVGNTATFDVTVTNDGTSTLTYDGVEHAGDTSFEITAGNGTESIAPSGSHTFTVSFTPTTEGTVSATFSVLTDDPESPSIDVSVMGTGVQPTEPSIVVTPTTLDFGNVSTGSSASANVTISNDGTADLEFSGLSSETPSMAFSVTSGAGPTVIAPGEDHNITVQFSPLSQADYTTSMSVMNSDRYVSFSLRGTGVEPNRPPFAAADHYVTVEDTNLTVSAPGRLANDLDPNGDSIIASHHGNPSHGTLHTSTTAGNFLYEPDQGFTGTDSFVYRIRDEHGEYSSYVPVTIDVLPNPNRAPQAIDDHYSVHAGETLVVNAPGRLANDRDPDNDSIIASHHSNPSHGTLVTSTTAGTFEYEPDPWFTGTDSFVYRIQDEHGEYSSYATVTIDVLPPRNREPTAVADTYSVSQGETLVVDAPGRLANDYDVDGDSIIASHHSNPSHGTLVTSTTAGTFEYEPDPGFTGTDSFVYRIQDEHGEYSSYATVTIEVAADNREPVAVADHYVTLKGENLTVSAPGRLANDYDLDNDSIIASHHGNPSHGTLHTSTTAGNFLYEPDPGFTGTDSFVYRIRDDHGEYSGYATVTIEVVDPAGTDPVAMPDNYTVYEGETLAVSAPGRLANDIDPNGSSIIASHHSNPTNGTLVSSTTAGTFEYVPNPGFSGTDSFVYRIQNDDGNYSSYVPVTIEVLPDPDTTGNRDPTAVDDTYSVFQGEALVVDAPGRLTNDYDPDNDSIIASHHGNPSHGTLVTSTTAGTFEYEPDQGFTGTDSFVYRIQDEHGEYSSFATVTIEVIPNPNREPKAIDDHYSTVEGETLVVDAPGRLVNDRDPDGDSIIASHHSNPSHGTLVTSTTAGTFEYEPDPGFSGTDSFVYRIQDEHGKYSGYATVTIDVLPDPNREPMAVPDNYVVLQGQSLVVDAPGRLANDYDLDNDSIIASHHSNPSHGTLVTSTTAGTFEYIPDASFTGVDSFVYRIQDEHGEYSSYAPVTITVVDGSVSGLADVVIPQDSIDFGPRPSGTTATETITVANIGNQNLTVYGATISGPNASDFAVTAGNATTILGYGGTNTIAVEFAPTTLDAADATLTVLTDDPDSEEQAINVTLSGEGYDADAPTITAIDVAGSYVDDSNTNGSVVYENETVAFEVGATDAHGAVKDVQVTLDSQTTADSSSRFATEDSSSGNWTTTIDVDALTDGRYDVVVRAYDGGANRRTVVANDSVVVDTDAPQLAASVSRLNETAANVTVNVDEALRTGTLTVDVERPDGIVTTVDVTDEGGHWNGTFELAGDGQYDITATALDLAGNRGTDNATARFATESTTNNTITVQMQPSGLFVRFNTNRSVNDTYITMTESKVPVAPLVRGQSGVKFIDAVLGKQLTENLTYATLGIPVDQSLLQPGADIDDVSIRYFNESRRQWTKVPTQVENVTLDGSTDRYWVATVTHFSTYGAVAADTTPPVVTSTSPVDGHELPAGTSSTTIRVEYDDALSGVDPAETRVVFDDTLVTTDPATTVTDEFVEFEVTGLADGTSHTVEVAVADEAGNRVVESFSFLVATTTDDDDDPTSIEEDDTQSDAEDGPPSIEDPPGASLVTITSLADGSVDVRLRTAGGPLTASFPAGAVGSNGVNFESLDLALVGETDAHLRVTAGASPPRETPPLPVDGALAFLNVSHPSLDDDDVSNVTFRFGIDREALADRDADPADVTLHRYHDGAWSPLETRLVNETDTRVDFEADSPGLSVFVVSAPAAQSTPTPTSTEPQTAGGPTTVEGETTTDSQTEVADSTTSVPLAILLVVVVLVLLAIVWLRIRGSRPD